MNDRLEIASRLAAAAYYGYTNVVFNDEWMDTFSPPVALALVQVAKAASLIGERMSTEQRALLHQAVASLTALLGGKA